MDGGRCSWEEPEKIGSGATERAEEVCRQRSGPPALSSGRCDLWWWGAPKLEHSGKWGEGAEGGGLWDLQEAWRRGKEATAGVLL